VWAGLSGKMSADGRGGTVSNELRSLLARVADVDPDTAKELRRHIDALQGRRQFGLNFERHMPESVALTGRPISVGDKVRFLPLRDEAEVESNATWTVSAITGPKKKRIASLLDPKTKGEASRALEDLVFVADFRDPIYPGLKRSDEPVLRGGDKPFHTVINAENYHALEALLFTHQGKVDCIYIDPPYNTGAKDWKYNNDYVDGEDVYRHSKWLAFMERRLKLARRLLNPGDSVLIVTIDEKEYLRLGLLLEQTFPEARIQMVSVVINPSGQKRDGAFRRSDEYLFVVSFGQAEPTPLVLGPEWRAGKTTSTARIRWDGFLRSGTGAQRQESPLKFYPIVISESGELLRIGDPIAPDARREDYREIGPGEVAIWPIRRDGSEGRWQTNVASAKRLLANGFIRTGRFNGERTAISYLKAGEQTKLAQGVFGAYEIGDDGYVVVESESAQGNRATPTTQWNLTAHSAADHGSSLLRTLIPRRKFPFPKSLYAVEDTLRFYLVDRPDTVVLDFFSGSGTTAHAVMRLNKQDGGRRRSICVTNNEVSADEQKNLIKKRLRPGDPEWEALGICDYITKPRIKAAVTGLTPDGNPIEGDYPFTDEFPMSDGFDENVEFFTLTYENPAIVELDLSFERIAPLLWMRAGSEGRRINERSDTFDVADTYAVLFNVDASKPFLAAVEKSKGLRIAYIVTDDETQYQAVAGQLPDDVESVRLYESYLRTFQINAGRA
jgi:adenine-specific DNA-methyltransferase